MMHWCFGGFDDDIKVAKAIGSIFWLVKQRNCAVLIMFWSRFQWGDRCWLDVVV